MEVLTKNEELEQKVKKMKTKLSSNQPSDIDRSSVYGYENDSSVVGPYARV